MVFFSEGFFLFVWFSMINGSFRSKLTDSLYFVRVLSLSLKGFKLKTATNQRYRHIVFETENLRDMYIHLKKYDLHEINHIVTHHLFL